MDTKASPWPGTTRRLAPALLSCTLSQQVSNSIHRFACGYCSACGRWKACDLASQRLSTFPLFHSHTVHSSVVADQRVYVNHPQAYAQGVSLAGPGAGVIGACSHAGRGLRPEPPLVRDEGESRQPINTVELSSCQDETDVRCRSKSAATRPTCVRLSPIRYAAPTCLNDLHRPACDWFASRRPGVRVPLAPQGVTDRTAGVVSTELVR